MKAAVHFNDGQSITMRVTTQERQTLVLALRAEGPPIVHLTFGSGEFMLNREQITYVRFEHSSR